MPEIMKEQLCYKQMKPPPKCLKSQKEKLCKTNSNEKQQVATLNVYSMVISQHILAPWCMSGNVDLARQVVQHQGPTELTASQHSMF